MKVKMLDLIKIKTKKALKEQIKELKNSIANANEALEEEKKNSEKLEKTLAVFEKREKQFGTLISGDNLMILMDPPVDDENTDYISLIENKVLIQQDVYYRSVSEIAIRNVTMVKCNLTHLKFENVVFENCNFISSKFEFVEFKNCTLVNCSFDGSVGYETNIDKCKTKDTDVNIIQKYIMTKVS